jgi:hypothetical protein
MLIRIRPRGGIFRERLKNLQIALRRIHLVQTSLDHRNLVISRRGITTHLDVSAQKIGSLAVFLVFRSQICEL